MRRPGLGWLLWAGRVLFLLAVAWFIWWGLRGRGEAVRHALGRTSLGGLALGLVLVLLGLLATGLLWRRLLAAFGHRIAVADALAIFFVGQLGKYLPGSVWSFGAQAERASRVDVPVRTTLAASLVFLGVNVVTATGLGFAVVLATPLDVALPTWLCVLAVVAAVVALSPYVVNRLAGWVAGPAAPLRLTLTAMLPVLGLMLAAWAAYAAATVAVLPHPTARTGAALVGAFLLAYAAGVVIVLAPAGLGAREATFVLVAAPVAGVATATSVALVTRLLLTAGDVLWAVASASYARRADREVSAPSR